MALERKHWQKAAWGVFLIALGAFLLLVQMDVVNVRDVWRWWPIILTWIGLVQMLIPGEPRQIASGLTNVLLSLWFFACTWHWYGFRYSTTWPLTLVIYGFDIVLAAVISRVSKGGERHA